MMDRSSALDAEFLQLEDGVSHMHIAGGASSRATARDRRADTR